MIKSILEIEKPDFIAVTGDVISGFAWDTKKRPWYSTKYKAFTKAMIESGIPWALTGGNHDEEGDLNST